MCVLSGVLFVERCQEGAAEQEGSSQFAERVFLCFVWEGGGGGIDRWVGVDARLSLD